MRFGTDGIRGVANSQLTPELALRIGRATARILGGDTISIGRDTRLSGPMLEASFIAGVCAEGASVEVLGVVPTPAVAYHSQRTGRAAAMISASHNPFGDNGIKLFAPGGTKLSDDLQRQLEAELDRLAGPDAIDASSVPTGGDVGSVSAFDVVPDYLDHVAESAAPGALTGLRVVLDCGNGASAPIAGPAFERLGAKVVVLNDQPNGHNINDGCGSTHPEVLAGAVVAHGADMGFAFDGDADRVVAVDASGRVIDGDHLIAMCAIDMHARGELANDTVVVTVMTNLGFRHAMAKRNISVLDTAVGDRYVLEALDAGAHVLGGEQSGHIIFRDRATTGDGVLSGVIVADAVARSGSTLGELADAAMTRLPQVLTNVRISAPMPDVAERLAEPLAVAHDALGESGRVLVRPSGTEPVVRVMVEAAELEVAQRWADELAGDVAQIDAATSR